ncbi:neuropeptide Y receptor type 2 [Cimex lectularius]|uniref:G-protein coupled receptors family 1 profile domain-containing protein n=1 Tax=Cimex lectularius TaxID=79782 RepID=A0A8I6SFS4_CIMLE|nr:neuropeptide Y receptor type 2 [Cimex lectularius]
MNNTVDLSKPHLRTSVKTIYPLFVFLYALLVTTGVVANLAMIFSIIKDKLYRDQTYCYLINMAIANIVEGVFVLPISLTILLVQNWIFGSFLCYFLPMLQDIPLHVSTLTLLLIAWDRHRFLKDPMKPRIPAFVCATGSWLTGICLVLPYPIYTTYLDLGKFMVIFKGVGICAVNLQDHIQEYTRGLFIAVYILPLGVTAYLFVRMSHQLQDQEGPLPVMLYEGSRARASTGSHGIRNGEAHLSSGTHRYRSNNQGLYQAELDVRKEKRTHKYLGTIATIFAICMCPLMILRVAKLALVETYDNSGHFDITYTMFVWIAFLPTATTPALYAAWRMSR